MESLSINYNLGNTTLEKALELKPDKIVAETLCLLDKAKRHFPEQTPEIGKSIEYINDLDVSVRKKCYYSLNPGKFQDDLNVADHEIVKPPFLGPVIGIIEDNIAKCRLVDLEEMTSV